MDEAKVSEFFDSLGPKINANPSRLSGMSAVYRFEIGDESYNVVIREGQAAVEKGAADPGDCTIRMARDDFGDLVTGKINPQVAFLTGKLKVSGDMGLALKLGDLLKG